MKRASWIGAVVAASILTFTITGLQAQPPGGRGGPGGAFGGAFGGGFGGPGGGGAMGMLMREDVRKELELLDDQIAELQKIGEGMRDAMRDAFSGDENVPREERFQKMRETMEKVQKDIQAKVDKVLLPHQAKRLKQLENQMNMRGGATRALGGGSPIADELGLTDAQKEKIRAKAEQLEAELRQKLAELRNKAQEELLKELTPQQQAKFKDMVGEPFEFQQPQFGRGGPGGPGAPGGGDQGTRGTRGARPTRGG